MYSLPTAIRPFETWRAIRLAFSRDGHALRRGSLARARTILERKCRARQSKAISAVGRGTLLGHMSSTEWTECVWNGDDREDAGEEQAFV